MVLYFIQAGDNGPIKIGTSDNPITRCAYLQIGNPLPLNLIGVLHCGYTEKELHIRFSSARIRGEWFAPTDELISFIKAKSTDILKIIGDKRMAREQNRLLPMPYAVRLYQRQLDWLDTEVKQRGINRQRLLRNLIDAAMNDADLGLCAICSMPLIVSCPECDS